MRSRKYQQYNSAEEFRQAMTDFEENNPEEAEAIRSGVARETAREAAAADVAAEDDGGIPIGEWIKEILIAIIVALIILQFLKPTIVKQRSMEPNFYTNDYVLVSRQSYKLLQGNPELGDVVIFETDMQTDSGEGKLLIKRVIGVPGDVVSIADGKVTVNGEEIDDSYTKDQFTSGEVTDLVVPQDSYFCLGDNRAVSVDSRSDEVGFVERDRIIGKAVFKVFPFKEFGFIKNPYEG